MMESKVNKLSNLRKNKKGFTLIEIIIVIVIIAILAAIAIPSMMGFVNQARESEYIAEARTAYVAGQTYLTQHVAANPSAITADGTDVKTMIGSNYTKYLGANTKVTAIKAATANKDGTITNFTCTLADGSTNYTVTIDTVNDTATCTKSK